MKNKIKIPLLIIGAMGGIGIAITVMSAYKNNVGVNIVRDLELFSSYAEVDIEINRPGYFSSTYLTSADRLLSINYSGSEAIKEVLNNLEKQDFNTQVGNRTILVRESKNECRFMTVVAFERAHNTNVIIDGTVWLKSKNLSMEECQDKKHLEAHSVSESEFNNVEVESAKLTLYYE